jgi:hypothetical protein
MSTLYEGNEALKRSWKIQRLFWHPPGKEMESRLYKEADNVYDLVKDHCCLMHENHTQLITVCHEKGFSGIGLILCCQLFEDEIKGALKDLPFAIETHHLSGMKRPVNK